MNTTRSRRDSPTPSEPRDPTDFSDITDDALFVDRARKYLRPYRRNGRLSKRGANLVAAMRNHYVPFIRAARGRGPAVADAEDEAYGFRDYLEERVDASAVRYSTASRVLGDVKAVLRAVVDDRAPWSHSQLKMERRAQAQGRKHDPTHLVGVVDAFPDDWSHQVARAAVYVCAFTGCRIAELASLRWSSFDFSTHTYRIPRSKIAGKESGMLAPQLEHFLQAVYRPRWEREIADMQADFPGDAVDEDALLPTRKVARAFHGHDLPGGGLNYTSDGIRAVAVPIMRASGVPDFTFHAIRRGSAQYLANLGFSDAEVAAFLRDEEAVMRAHYVDSSVARQARAKLAQAFAPAAPAAAPVRVARPPAPRYFEGAEDVTQPGRTVGQLIERGGVVGAYESQAGYWAFPGIDPAGKL